MDCCRNNNDHNTSSKKEDSNEEIKQKSEIKGEKIKMNKRTVLWIVIGILFLAVLYLTFKVNTLDVGVVQSTGAAVQSAASSSSRMVGGC